ncbi:efflux RND transporter permease subunit [Gayadomonas joobiniege]|uniref:efflux RND transporter permease subunit n=1 Tax=Gayadomonas joobiniege TaxID=1234606 RepID=UPI000361B19B|nr:CusA/CzcA family heavy metal efflux RND transporter [Gayadomonas joobiniege]
MIGKIIHWSVANRILVLLLTLISLLVGIYAVKNTPVDAIPDLSDVQVIIKTSYPGQAPQVVQDQVTFPLTSAMMSVPGAQTVRGYSFFGDSYVYVIFDDDTDLYWARSRVIEYLNQASASLPPQAKPQLGPDATGVGWVFIYALQDKSGQHDLSQLTSIQDWFLKYELQTVPGVSEIATVGGLKKQYQVQVDPHKLRAFNMPLNHVTEALKRGNQSLGASVIEMAEAEYMVTSNGYIQSLQDINNIPLGVNEQGSALTIADIAHVTLGPQMRRGIAELNGQGETVGGIVVMRFGENAQATIQRIKQKINSLALSLPAGVEIIPVYDRSKLIKESLDNLWQKLFAELAIVALVCFVFLFHLRSSLVAVISLPMGILIAFIIMYWQNLNANIMSLGGLAIAIGAMTDGAIVMIENVHKHLHKYAQNNPSEDFKIAPNVRWKIVAKAASEVGPALFFSLLIMTVSFLPVFILEAQEGRLFTPLAYTKTYAMAATAALAITLVPVLMGYCIRGPIPAADKNRLNLILIALYKPVLKKVLEFPKTSISACLLVSLLGFWPLDKIGSEFMPPLDEGDLMYMPTTYPSISIGKARELLQQTDKLIRTVPEVQNVFGKVGRAESATDPAPLTMIETFIQLKPKSLWREGMTSERLQQTFEQLVQFPGVSNAWVMPIKTRIDMLATGIKSPIGIKISGPELSEIEKIGLKIETLLSNVPGTTSVYAERVAGGRYLTIDILRDKASRYGMNVDDVQQLVRTAIGGQNITETVEGQARYAVNIRYLQDFRNSPETLARLPIITPTGAHISLGDITELQVTSGPAGIKSENARLNGVVFIDIKQVDIGSYVADAQQYLAEHLKLPAGYSLTWAGQYEYMARAADKLMYVLPLTLAVIVILLYLNFKTFIEVLLILMTLPVATIGGLWLVYIADFNFSVAVAVGFIALAGVAVEIGVLVLVYLNQALDELKLNAYAKKQPITDRQYLHVIVAGASLRVRPVMMTVATIIAGLLPLLFTSGTGSEVISRIAAPMVGGMVSALVLTLILLPVLYALVKQSSIQRFNQNL